MKRIVETPLHHYQPENATNPAEMVAEMIEESIEVDRRGEMTIEEETATETEVGAEMTCAMLEGAEEVGEMMIAAIASVIGMEEETEVCMRQRILLCHTDTGLTLLAKIGEISRESGRGIGREIEVGVRGGRGRRREIRKRDGMQRGV